MDRGPASAGKAPKLHHAAAGRSYPCSPSLRTLDPSLQGGQVPPPRWFTFFYEKGCLASEARQGVAEALVVKVPPELVMWATGPPTRSTRSDNAPGRLSICPAEGELVHKSMHHAARIRLHLDGLAQPGREQRACAIGSGREAPGPTALPRSWRRRLLVFTPKAEGLSHSKQVTSAILKTLV
jgi:hypothetical protein